MLGFLSIDGEEIDTSPLLNPALEEGKPFFFPRIEGRDLAFYQYTGEARRGSFGIREPPWDAPALDEGISLLVLCPGMAFDRRLRRLGRGGGYYDRFLTTLDTRGRDYTALGLCMPCQVVEEVPAEEWDKPVDAVLAGGVLLEPAPGKIQVRTQSPG